MVVFMMLELYQRILYGDVKYVLYLNYKFTYLNLIKDSIELWERKLKVGADFGLGIDGDFYDLWYAADKK